MQNELLNHAIFSLSFIFFSSCAVGVVGVVDNSSPLLNHKHKCAYDCCSSSSTYQAIDAANEMKLRSWLTMGVVGARFVVDERSNSTVSCTYTPQIHTKKYVERAVLLKRKIQ